MKRIICSAIFGLTICESVFAISVEDRRRFCEQYPYYVWVEMTDTCIPKNPCTATNLDIRKAYCIDATQIGANDEMVFETYIRYAIGGEWTKKERLQKQGEPFLAKTKTDWYSFTAYHTSSGGYVVFAYKEERDVPENRCIVTAIKDMCWAIQGDFEEESENTASCSFGTFRWADKCIEMTKKVEILTGAMCTGFLVNDGNRCKITCEEK